MRTGSPEWLAKVNAMTDEELRTGQLGWWYLSFVDDSRPKGDQFVGGIFVKAYGFGTAVRKTHKLGINPGGEIQGVPAPPGMPAPPWNYRHRLLTRKEIDEADAYFTEVSGQGERG